MRIGVSFDGFSPFPEDTSFAREAVAAGAESLWMADHLGYREAIVSCLGLALAAPPAKVVPIAVSPYLRHPMPTAMQIATLAEAAPGRVALTLGIGNPLFLTESGEAIDKPVRVIREFVEALRALWSGRPVEMEAERFRLEGARMMFAAPSSIPIYLAPMREQMLRLAGRIGDGVLLSAGISVAYAHRSLAVVDEGLATAGRPRDAIARAGCVFFMAAQEPRRAIDAVRRKLAFVLRNKFLDENLAFTGIPIDQAAIIEAIGRRDFDGATALVPDEAVEAFAVAGSPAQCRDRIAAFEAAGLDQVVLMMTGAIEDRRFGLASIKEMLS
jgi:5,10-methylenetetrahydromethanopterin reductase